MSPRLAWFGALLVVGAAACANIFDFSDLQVAPGDDASIIEQDSSEDFTFPPVRTDALGGVDRVDSRVGDAGGACVDTDTDPANCGSCGNACASGAMCLAGACKCPAAQATPCSGVCVDLSSDHGNCGGCGNVCTLAQATSVCASSTCAISSCVAGYVDCNQMASDGCEVNTTNDPNNCGGCGNVCNLPNASASCSGSSCAIASCSPGYADCDTLASTGCEVNTAGDPSHCGNCGTVCTLPHATARCTIGMCAIASCNAGFADCDGNAMNGCETDLSQPPHCGTCSNACASGMLCSVGSCVSICSGNTSTLCNGSCANTTMDVNNCGGCGTKCTAPANAVATCSGSPPTCGFSCNPSYTLCTSSMTCVDVRADPNNCGSCGTRCPAGGGCDGGCGKRSKGGG